MVLLKDHPLLQRGLELSLGRRRLRLAGEVLESVRLLAQVVPLGDFFGEYNRARDGRVIQLGVKLYF